MECGWSSSRPLALANVMLRLGRNDGNRCGSKSKSKSESKSKRAEVMIRELEPSRAVKRSVQGWK